LKHILLLGAGFSRGGWQLHRVVRDVFGVAIIERIHKHGCLVKVLDKPDLDLNTPLGRSIAFLSAVAEGERQRISV